ncbi:MAG: hypothetical protein ACLSFZ_02550 [Frisingicoccus sp.]
MPDWTWKRRSVRVGVCVSSVEVFQLEKGKETGGKGPGKSVLHADSFEYGFRRVSVHSDAGVNHKCGDSLCDGTHSIGSLSNFRPGSRCDVSWWCRLRSADWHCRLCVIDCTDFASDLNGPPFLLIKSAADLSWAKAPVLCESLSHAASTHTGGRIWCNIGCLSHYITSEDGSGAASMELAMKEAE